MIGSLLVRDARWCAARGGAVWIRIGLGATLPERGCLADPIAQEVELGPSDLAVADNLDLLDPGAVDLECPLDADAARDLADGDRARDPTPAEPHHGALEDLDALLASLDDPRCDANGVTGRELGQIGADLVGGDLVEDVHGRASLGCMQRAAAD